MATEVEVSAIVVLGRTVVVDPAAATVVVLSPEPSSPANRNQTSPIKSGTPSTIESRVTRCFVARSTIAPPCCSYPDCLARL